MDCRTDCAGIGGDDVTHNSDKIILDLCGGTGAWSKPYKDAGYDVRLITLPEYDITRVDFAKHAMHFERMDVHYHDNLTVLYKDIYGILAAPPCTEFSLAKGGQPRNFEGAMTVVKACMEIIWRCRIYGKPKFWALENPVGFLRQFLGRPDYTFEQWWFGDKQVKRTDLWGYYNQPSRTVCARPDDMTKQYPNGRSNGRTWAAPKPPNWLDASNLTRADLRSITPQGFAEAFYRANR